MSIDFTKNSENNQDATVRKIEIRTIDFSNEATIDKYCKDVLKNQFIKHIIIGQSDNGAIHFCGLPDLEYLMTKITMHSPERLDNFINQIKKAVNEGLEILKERSRILAKSANEYKKSKEKKNEHV